MDAKFDCLPDDSSWIPNSLDRENGKGIYHSEWRNYLNEINKEEVNRLLTKPINGQRFVLYTRYVAKYFHLTAKQLVMPPDVFYLAIEIFDRFWVNYLCQSRDKMVSRLSSLSSDPQVFRRDICLLSLSCIQLASKQCYANNILAVPVIVDTMKKSGFTVSKRDVIFSELKVFQTIRWVIPNVTILSYVEMFVEQLTNILPMNKKSEFIQICTKVLNVAINFHKEIYTKLHIAFKNRQLRTTREKSLYLAVEGDFIRLAASVVCTGGMLYDPSFKLADVMMEHLSKTTSYQRTEIKVLSQIILHIILRKQRLHPN